MTEKKLIEKVGKLKRSYAYAVSYYSLCPHCNETVDDDGMAMNIDKANEELFDKFINVWHCPHCKKIFQVNY